MVKVWTTKEIIEKDYEYDPEVGLPEKELLEWDSKEWVLLSDHEAEIKELQNTLKEHYATYEEQRELCKERIIRLEAENKPLNELFSELFTVKSDLKLMNPPSPKEVRMFVDELIKKNVSLLEENGELKEVITIKDLYVKELLNRLAKETFVEGKQ